MKRQVFGSLFEKNMVRILVGTNISITSVFSQSFPDECSVGARSMIHTRINFTTHEKKIGMLLEKIRHIIIVSIFLTLVLP